MAHAVIHHPRASRVTNTTPTATYTAVRVIWAVLAVIETLIGLRFLLRLFGANPAAGFTDLVYTLSQPLVAPFQAVFPAARIEGEARSGVFDWSLLLAMAIYWLIAWGIVRLLTPTRTATVVEEDIEYIEEV